MAQVRVNKNLDDIQDKKLFGLTKRQLICFGSGGLIAVGAYFFCTRLHLGMDISMIVGMIFGFPFFLAGIYKKDGLYLEDMMLAYISYRFLRPRVRIYQSNNLYGFLREKTYQKEVLGLPLDNEKDSMKSLDTLSKRKNGHAVQEGGVHK